MTKLIIIFILTGILITDLLAMIIKKIIIQKKHENNPLERIKKEKKPIK